ncbi:MAG: glycosyltransferase family 4 protein [Vicinamibacteria bacterium]
MKILYVIGAFGPRYLANEINRELVQEWSGRGHTCLIYAGVTPAELEGDPVSYWDGHVMVYRQLCEPRGRHRLTAGLGRALFRYPRFLPLLGGLRRLLAHDPDIDVIHVEAVYPLGTMAALAAIGHRAVLVPSIQGGDLIDYPGYGYARFPLLRHLIRWTFRRATLVRANSPLMAQRAGALGCAAAKLREVPVNIGDRFFLEKAPLAERRAEARADVRRRLGLEPEGPLVLSTGRLLPLKGFHDLVAATAILARQHPKVRVLIAGPNFVDPRLGDQRRALQESIERLGVQDQVRLLGTLEHESEMPAYLAAADFVVAAAHIEGMNKVVPEAGSQGTPAIVSRTTGVASSVESWAAGLVVEPRDVPALAEAMIRMIADPMERERMGRNALEMSRRFRVSVVAEQLIDLYSSALERVGSEGRS